MRYSEIRADMRIRHKESKQTAIVGSVKDGKFVIVDDKGAVQTLDRFYAGEWDAIK